MKLFITSCLIAGLMSFCLMAHEGHDSPGALPLAPNGGVVKEAAHKIVHSHDGGEDELFFEALYKNGTLKVYPLILPVSNTKAFTALSPKELVKVDLQIEFPRTGKHQALTPKVTDTHFEADLDVKGANRFIVDISVMHKNEIKSAKIQVEPK